MPSRKKAPSSSGTPRIKRLKASADVASGTNVNTDTSSHSEAPPRVGGRASAGHMHVEEVIVIDSSPSSSPVLIAISPPPTPSPIAKGNRAWKMDFEQCKVKWAAFGEIEGYAGMMGTIQEYGAGETDDSTRFKLVYEDIEGRGGNIALDIVYNTLDEYPEQYDILVYSEGKVNRQAEKTFSRFAKIHHLPLPALYSRILASLQGDDEANGGKGVVASQEEDEETEEELDEDEMDDAGGDITFKNISMASFSRDSDWSSLREHFEQAKAMGFRPGLTKLDLDHVLSFSIPLKNLPIDPNMLAIWDDGLVDAWKDDQRFTMLIKIESYPPHPDKMEFFLGFHKNYKPSASEITETLRRIGGLRPFYLSTALLGFLKVFARAYKVRTSFPVDWAKADSIAFDEEKASAVFQNGEVPFGNGSVEEEGDPISKGFDSNVPLCAFWWTIRRFIEANKYCLNCGLEASVRSLRPYVCEKALCLYGFMSLGLGPSIEHVIIHHPAVVDLLLTFAYDSAKTLTRMELPLQLSIEVPPDYEPVGMSSSTLLDQMGPSAQRLAVAWLIEKLPKVSEIRTALIAGQKLYQLGVPPGSIGVLRWVIGSCRAYLREAKPGEGVIVNGYTSANPYGHSGSIRQFTFVVGSPEQEVNFKEEVVKAQSENEQCQQYPTMLAFHGSGKDRWHNILRTGLDYSETANGRSYGHGVYFASEYTTSMQYTHSRMMSASGHTAGPRPNADFTLNSAIALVELVNVPSTFVSSTPFYVVNNVKQIKPFMLLVSGPSTSPATTTDTAGDGELFKHDPTLERPTTYQLGRPVEVRMPKRLESTAFVDEEPDDADDDEILHPKGPILFEASPRERFAKLQMMPPPSSTSTLANRALAKEWKELLQAQAEGGLPFYINPDNDSLYCWIFELFDFPDTALKKDLEAKEIRSVIAEMRFPASYPHSPPFFRVLHPRFLPFSQGGGGNITAGGSFCNEGLTATKANAGWNPTCRIETIVRDVMVNMTAATPPARIDPRSWDMGYGLGEAIQAYKRVATFHGWDVPGDFDKIAV